MASGSGNGSAAELARGALDSLRYGSERGRPLRVGPAAFTLRGVRARPPGHAQQVLGFGVVGLEIAIAPRPASARVAGDFRRVVEVLGPESEGNSAIEDRRAADAVERARLGRVMRGQRTDSFGGPVLRPPCHPIPSLEHEHRPTRVNQGVRGHRSSEPAADHDRVVPLLPHTSLRGLEPRTGQRGVMRAGGRSSTTPSSRPPVAALCCSP